ncbi:MAG: leucine-rich repeat protein [Clostridia bacterium]|nr:leucine-rich repeat protein [Clostridia bacterium]
MHRYDNCGLIQDGKVVAFRAPNGFDGNIVIPDDVTEIGNRAYEVAFCGIKKVVIPSSVKRIGVRAFACCEKLQEIEIPTGVEIIDKEAFSDCHSLKKIIISETVTSIGSGAFDDCGDIEEISVAADNPVYRSSGNCLIDIKKKTLIRGCKNSVIPSDGSVTVIGEKAFSNNTAHPRNRVHSKGSSEIVIPDGITKIGKRAFDFNYGLETVIIADSVKTIEKEAFSSCYKLKSIKFGKGVETIGDSAFYYTNSLTGELSFPDSVKKIGAYAFFNSGVKNIVMGKNVKSIGKNAFNGCKNLTEITFTGDIEEICESAFHYCKALETVNFSDNLKIIGKLAFYGCDKLKNLTFKNGLETIGECAFGYCGSLQSIDVPDSVKYIGAEAFIYCENLRSVKIPSSVDFMGSNVFKACPVKVAAPKKVGAVGFEIANNELIKYKGTSDNAVIPDGVTKIAAKAFFRKKNLESITIPKSVTAIANRAIEGCANLKCIKVDEANTAYRSAGNCLIDVKKKSVVYGFANSVIPSDGSVTAIAAYAFAEIGFTAATIPDGIKTIGANAFKGCTNLKNLSLPDTVKSIGPSAFKYCKALESITVPQKVTSLGTEAFAECTSLTEINFDAECDNLSCNSAFDSAGKNSSGVVLRIGSKVKRIPPYLMMPQNNENMPHIISVEFSENSVCECIGSTAFWSCLMLKSVNLPESLTQIERDAFHGCSALEHINIPENTTAIGAYAFDKCTSLKEIYIPSKVSKLISVFEGCGGLESITVAKSNPVFHSSGNCLIETETKKLLRGCHNSVIPSDGSVTRLDNYSFDKCDKLESIVIPDGVVEIFNNAFRQCSNLKSVTIAKTVDYVCNPYFEDCNELIKITAAKELLEKYDYFGFKDKVFGLKNRRVEFSFL